MLLSNIILMCVCVQLFEGLTQSSAGGDVASASVVLQVVCRPAQFVGRCSLRQ